MEKIGVNNKSEYHNNVDKLTIQSGGNLNGLFVRENCKCSDCTITSWWKRCINTN